ncbi:MAG: hypothetical protein LBT44_02350 [Clostridiales bacterium]|jgi:hypothetical protein|nr:hypothetical protein [Clostridiales bacterium]
MVKLKIPKPKVLAGIAMALIVFAESSGLPMAGGVYAAAAEMPSGAPADLETPRLDIEDLNSIPSPAEPAPGSGKIIPTPEGTPSTSDTTSTEASVASDEDNQKNDTENSVNADIDNSPRESSPKESSSSEDTSAEDNANHETGGAAGVEIMQLASGTWDLSAIDIRGELKQFFDTYMLDEQLAVTCNNRMNMLAEDAAAQLYIAWKTGGPELTQFISDAFEQMDRARPAAEASKPVTGLDFNRAPGAADKSVVFSEGSSSRVVNMFSDSYAKYRVDLRFTVQNTTSQEKKLSMILLRDLPWLDENNGVGFDYVSRDASNFQISSGNVIFSAAEVMSQENYQSGQHSGAFLKLASNETAVLIAPNASADVTVSYWLQAKMSPEAGVRNVNVSMDASTQCAVFLGAAQPDEEWQGVPDPSMEFVTQVMPFGGLAVTIPPQCQFGAFNPYHVFLKGTVGQIDGSVKIKKTARDLADLNTPGASEYTIAELPAAWLNMNNLLEKYFDLGAEVSKEGQSPENVPLAHGSSAENDAESYVNFTLSLDINADVITGVMRLTPRYSELNASASPFVIRGASAAITMTLTGGAGYKNQRPEGVFDVVALYTDESENKRVFHVPFQLSAANGYKESQNCAVPAGSVRDGLVLGVYAPYGYQAETLTANFSNVANAMAVLSNNYWVNNKNAEVNLENFLTYINQELTAAPPNLAVELSVKPIFKPWIRGWAFLGMMLERRFGL